MNNAESKARVIEVSLGDDLVLGQAVVASLAAEGIETELVLSSDPYVGLEHTSPHRLMISEADIDAARPIVQAHIDGSSSGEPPLRRLSGTRKLVGLLLLVMFAGGPLVGLIVAVRQVLTLF